MTSSNKGFVSLLGLILSIAIICILFYISLKVYFKKLLPEGEIKKSLEGQGIDTSSYPAVLDSSKKKIEDINRQIHERDRQLQDLR